jgi:hypothetical protein
MNLVYSLRVNSADPAQPDTQQRVSGASGSENPEYQVASPCTK